MPPGTQAGVCAAADRGCRNIDTAPTDMPKNARLPKPVMQCPHIKIQSAQPAATLAKVRRV
jgi:hypothetical protein